MRISSITSDFILPQSRPEKSLPPEEAPLTSAVKLAPNTKEALAQAFYTREKEPWLKSFYTFTDYTGPVAKTEIRPMTKERYLVYCFRKNQLLTNVKFKFYQ
ncbi:hypothetical protein GCM10009085_31560 [Pseudomonas avellanae]|nr:hypothetical protein GCM10009085_31560 [Pseudomonas avellanae]